MAENYYLNHTATQIDAILTKVDGIAAGANVNVQVDWNQTTTTADDYIKNKPTIPAAQVNSDWNAASGVAQILNKPTIPDAQIQSDWNQNDTESKDFIKNKPTIPAAQVNADWDSNSGVSQILHKPTLGTAAAKDYTTSVSGLSDDLITSSAVNTALSTKANLVDGKVPASELPSYVDDTVEGYYHSGAFYEDAEHTIAITGETGKIYIDLTTNKSYRWTGTVYVRIDECPAFGETQGTIYEGHKGKANADDITAIKDGTTIDSFGDVETALSGKVDKVSGKGLSENDYTTAEKTKLAGVETGATKVTVDDALSPTSTNPVQNKVISAAIGDIIDPTEVDSQTIDTIPKTTFFGGSGAPFSQYTDWIGMQVGYIDPSGGGAYDSNAFQIVNVDTTNRLMFRMNDGGSWTNWENVAFASDLNNKVDKETGKGLSTNDYTTTEKNKLAGIASGAEVNVQSDWNQTTTTADDYIKNKPTLTTSSTEPTSTGWYTVRNNSGTVQYYAKFYSNATTSDAGLMSSTDKSKIDLCPSVTKTQSTFTSGTSIEDTGISVSVSADSVTRVTGYLVYFSNKPTEIQLRQVYNGTESMLAYAIPDSHDSFSTARHNLSVSAIVTKNSTVKLYAKYDGVSSNIGGIVKEVF